jgi:LysM repeat protein
MECQNSYFEYYAGMEDTFASVAQKFQVSEKELKEYNDIPAVTLGCKVRIPSKSGGCGKGVFYTIKKGDTLSRIAKRARISVETLLQNNPFLNPSRYIPGQVIILPLPEQIIAYYTLGKNERLANVLRRYDMDISTFCALNPGINPIRLREGQRVTVRKTQPHGRRYTVQPGDTLVTVADKFGLRVSSLLAANRDFKPGAFVPGVTLHIPYR